MQQPPPIPVDSLSSEAVASLTQARERVRTQPGDAKTWGYLGLSFIAQGLDPQAAECFQVAQKLDPTDDRWPYFLALYSLLQLNNPNLALQQLEGALTCHHPHTQRETTIRLRLADLYLSEQKYAEAEKHYRRQLELDPHDERAFLGLGMLSLATDRIPDAISFLEKAKNSPFTRRQAVSNLSTAYRRSGDLARVATYEDLATRLPEDRQPPDPFTHEAANLNTTKQEGYERVEALQRSGRILETLPILENLAKQPDNIRAHVALGQNLTMLGRMQEAETHLQLAYETDPKHVQAAMLYGTLLFDMAHAPDLGGEKKTTLLQKAVKACDRAIELKSDVAMAHFCRANATRELGDTSGSLKYFRAARDCRPDVLQFQIGYMQALMDNRLYEDSLTQLSVLEKLLPAQDNRLAVWKGQIEKAKTASK